MLRLKLIAEKFSQVDSEWQWTYACLTNFVFNQQKITYLTITDHLWQKKGREWMTKEHVLNIFYAGLSGERKEPRVIINKRAVFVEEFVPYLDKDYLLVFWFKDNEDNHLWVRNCYQIS